MKFRPFENGDLGQMSDWYRARNMKPIAADMLPTTGCIVPDVAAGFLYLTDSSLCLLENYISNPAASSEERDEALDGITAALLAVAAAQGYRHAVALTQDQAICDRAQRHGLVWIGDYKMSHRELPWAS